MATGPMTPVPSEVTPMSNSTRTPQTTGESEPAYRHETVHSDLRPGDLARVITTGRDVDRAEVIAKWPFAQADFDPKRHPEIPTKQRTWAGHTAGEGEKQPEIQIDGTAMRTTLETEDGRRYAVADWTATDDPPFLYMLVIDSDRPGERRWDRVGQVQSVERYGPEPVYRMTGFQWSRSRDRQTRVLSLAADGHFDHTNPAGELPERTTLQDLADRLGADEPRQLTREDLSTLDLSYDAAREHVDRTGDTILTDDPGEDLSRLDRTFSPGQFIALFPDGNGGWIERHKAGHGPPSEDIPPWKAEANAKPTFTPLGEWSE